MSGLAVYRVFKTKRAATALTGEGAARTGGRWNFPGTAVVYCSSSLALAQLEILVHLSGIEPPSTFQFAEITIPDACEIHHVDLQYLESLPFEWRSHPPHGLLQQIGHDWINGGNTPVLKVPSAVSPDEFNYLLNPEHVQFKNIISGDARDLVWDKRLFRRESGA